jgi:excinuclease ABC subunit A
LIDMGPEGGHHGGTVVAVGTPEELAETPASYTGRFLRPVLGLSGEPAGSTAAVARAARTNGIPTAAGAGRRTGRRASRGSGPAR